MKAADVKKNNTECRENQVKTWAWWRGVTKALTKKMTHRNSLPVFPLCDLKYIWIQSEFKKKKNNTCLGGQHGSRCIYWISEENGADENEGEPVVKAQWQIHDMPSRRQNSVPCSS